MILRVSSSGRLRVGSSFLLESCAKALRAMPKRRVDPLWRCARSQVAGESFNTLPGCSYDLK